jgi:hypothetical protein
VLFAAFSVAEAALLPASAVASPALFAAFSVAVPAFCAVSPAAVAAPPAAPAAAAPAAAAGLLDVEDVSSFGGVALEGDALDGLVAHVEETMLALSTLMVSPLAVPVTETVWPT